MENKRQPTQRDIAISTLENKVLQDVLSNNQILENQSLYGTLAVNGAKNTYREAMNSEEARAFKDVLYEKKLANGKKKGVYGMPSIDDYDVSTAIIDQLNENKRILSLGDLEDVVKNLGQSSGYDFEVSEKIKKYVPAKLQEKMEIAAIKARYEKKEIDPRDALSEEEKYALDVYEFLSLSYDRGVALKACNYFADLNKLGKKIKENYEPKDSKE